MRFCSVCMQCVVHLTDFSQTTNRGTQRLFSVKNLFGDAKIPCNFLLLEEG